MSSTIEQLNRKFGLPSLKFVEGPGGLPAAAITNGQATATIFLQGAHLTAWTPKGQEPVVWLSEKALFAEGKAIRGGIPICWPWFGAGVPGAPAHGYARTTAWEAIATAENTDGSTALALRLPTGVAGLACWPHCTPAEIRFTVGETLKIELVTHSHEAQPVEIGQALHAYFKVGDISRVEILGLDGCPYIDKTDNGKRKQQQGPITIDREVDRIYLKSQGDCIIDDPILNRRIVIGKQGSASTIVWNPWKDNGLADMDEQGHLGMVCVETANAGDDTVLLPPGGEHRLTASYAVHPR